MLPAAIPDTERAALAEIYTATGGEVWNQKIRELRISPSSLEARMLRRELKRDCWDDEQLESDGLGPRGTEGNWVGVTVEDGHVTEIRLAFHDLSGFIPSQISELTHLKKLVLGSFVSIYRERLRPRFKANTKGNGTLKKTLEKSEVTKKSRSAISGHLPAELSDLKYLEVLSIFNCNISGPIPPELGNLSSLKSLTIKGNRLDAEIPPELGMLSHLQHLDLSNNKLSGEIPVALKHLKQLKTLRLSGNLLNGPIPSEIGIFENLEVLNLDNNQLSGIIPGTLGNLARLRDLSLRSNRLKGRIPHEFGNLSRLRFIYLNNNRLTGAIPYEIGNLKKLQQVHLSGNNLIGELPFSLTDCPIYYINFDYNGLYTTNPDLKRRFDRVKETWTHTQTTPPGNVKAAFISPEIVRVSWEPIQYVVGKGGYLVYYSESLSGEWIHAGTTKSKRSTYFDVKELEPGFKYYFIVKTRSEPNANNKNDIVSDPGQPVTTADKNRRLIN